MFEISTVDPTDNVLSQVTRNRSLEDVLNAELSSSEKDSELVKKHEKVLVTEVSNERGFKGFQTPSRRIRFSPDLTGLSDSQSLGGRRGKCTNLYFYFLYLFFIHF